MLCVSRPDPGVQLGSKIRSDGNGSLVDVMSANRPVRPGHGCLWCNQLIDTNLLAKEAKTDEERKAQAYGTEEANPSVISLNAVSAAHGVNEFLLDFLDLRPEAKLLHYEHFHFLASKRSLVEPRKDAHCPKRSARGSRFGRGGGILEARSGLGSGLRCASPPRRASSGNDAEDAVQEAALRAWRSRRNRRSGTDLRPWFLAIVANQCREDSPRCWASVLRFADPPEPATVAAIDATGSLDMATALRSRAT